MFTSKYNCRLASANIYQIFYRLAYMIERPSHGCYNGAQAREKSSYTRGVEEMQTRMCDLS